ncbi:hypothetical protein [Kitasatospora griseola]
MRITVKPAARAIQAMRRHPVLQGALLILLKDVADPIVREVVDLLLRR